MPTVPTTPSPLSGNLPGGPSPERILHIDSAARAERYNSLMAKMAAFQRDDGPAPTLAEFEQWKEDAAFERAIGRLLAKALLPR